MIIWLVSKFAGDTKLGDIVGKLAAGWVGEGLGYYLQRHQGRLQEFPPPGTQRRGTLGRGHAGFVDPGHSRTCNI